MRLGIDVSTCLEEEEHGAKYFDGERQIDPLEAFRANGVDIVRIRVWVDPYGEHGEPYLAGNCDEDNFYRLALLVQEKGYSVLLDIHYSDFWVDPGKQTMPKSWRGQTFEQLKKTVYEYTRHLLVTAKARGIKLWGVQVGNEITNGMLWPVGKLTGGEDGSVRSGYDKLIPFLKEGVKACREECPEAKIIIHLERSYDVAVYDEYFTQLEKANLDYDVIGYSYYPYWHGSFDMFFANVEMCKKFKKELMVMEVSYVFTLEDYIKEEAAHLVISEENASKLPYKQAYPFTKEGQAAFTKDFLSLCKEHGIAAVFWWEPLWIPGDGLCWASEAAQNYIGETGKSTRNEWANQCLFDYEGKKLPAFDEYKV